MDNENYGYIAYNGDYNLNLASLNLLSETDTGWNNSVLDTSGAVFGGAIGIKIGQQNNINIIYTLSIENPFMRCLKYAYKDGNSWSYEIIDTTVLGFSGAMEITQDGSIHVAYLKSNGPYSNLYYAFRQDPQNIISEPGREK